MSRKREEPQAGWRREAAARRGSRWLLSLLTRGALFHLASTLARLQPSLRNLPVYVSQSPRPRISDEPNARHGRRDSARTEATLGRGYCDSCHVLPHALIPFQHLMHSGYSPTKIRNFLVCAAGYGSFINIMCTMKCHCSEICYACLLLLYLVKL